MEISLKGTIAVHDYVAAQLMLPSARRMRSSERNGVAILTMSGAVLMCMPSAIALWFTLPAVGRVTLPTGASYQPSFAFQLGIMGVLVLVLGAGAWCWSTHTWERGLARYWRAVVAPHGEFMVDVTDTGISSRSKAWSQSTSWEEFTNATVGGDLVLLVAVREDAEPSVQFFTRKQAPDDEVWRRFREAVTSRVPLTP